MALWGAGFRLDARREAIAYVVKREGDTRHRKQRVGGGGGGRFYVGLGHACTRAPSQGVFLGAREKIKTIVRYQRSLHIHHTTQHHRTPHASIAYANTTHRQGVLHQLEQNGQTYADTNYWLNTKTTFSR